MQVTHRRHCLHAALFWSGTGLVMSFFGVGWVWIGFTPPSVYLFLLLCLLVGFGKGEFAIGRAGKKAIVRIEALPEKSSFYKVFTRGQWFLILGMMALGMLIRFSGLEKNIRGLVLATVGFALLWGSRYFWKVVWRKP